MAADRFNFFGDVIGRPALGSLERHVFQHMGNAVDIGCFVARADVHPGPDRRRLHIRHAIRYHP